MLIFFYLNRWPAAPAALLVRCCAEKVGVWRRDLSVMGGRTVGRARMR